MRKLKCLIISWLLLLVVTVSASEMVAKITAYNGAELSGEVPVGTEVVFLNSNHSKGQLTAGSTATMSISHLPKGAITKVVLYIKSNATSGAGFAFVKLDNVTIGSLPQSSYAEWRETGYSTAYLPFEFEGMWQTSAGSGLTIEVGATENSLGWDKVEITYLIAEDKPRTIALQWFDAQGKQQSQSLSEKTAGAGVVLPECEVKELFAEDEWTFAGWTKDPITEVYTSSPNYYLPGEKYYPKVDNETLYALYSVAPEVPDIVQATDFKTGEYVLAMQVPNGYVVPYGEVVQKKLRTSPYSVSKGEDGLYHFDMTSHFPVYYRYQLTFEGDSVQIKNLESGSLIGHTSTYLSDRNTKWAWRESLNHSVEFSYDRNETGNKPVARVLWQEDLGNDITIINIITDIDFEYFLLFEVSDVPINQPQTRWTGYPFGWQAIEATSASKLQVRKILKNGIIYIEINHAKYDILGNKIL